MSDPHETSAELAYQCVTDTVAQLADGRLSSLELVTALLERIEAIDGPSTVSALRAIAAVSPDALAVARERDDQRAGGGPLGPLHGVPVVVKDNIEALGLPGLAGSTSLHARPAREAPLVARLRDAGAIVMASTNLSQWANIRSARSTSGWSATGGLVANPWALDRSAGGSSSGSGAALAAGLAPLAVGTETDGSIVCPASVNGVVGLKPTVGAVPTAWVVPVSTSQDSPGPMARCVDDVARLFAVLSGRAPELVSRPRVTVAANWRTGDPATDERFDEVVAALIDAGLAMTSREVPEPAPAQQADETAVLLAELADDLSAYLAARPGDGVHSLADVIAFEDRHRDVEQPFFGHDLFVAAAATGGRRGVAYAPARERNLAWAREVCLGPALEGVDVVLAPAFGPAWKSDLVVGGHPGAASVATTPAAIAGWPIASVPIGFVHGLPIGASIIARPNAEWVILEVAATIEAVVGGGYRRYRPSFAPATRG